MRILVVGLLLLSSGIMYGMHEHFGQLGYAFGVAYPGNHKVAMPKNRVELEKQRELERKEFEKKKFEELIMLRNQTELNKLREIERENIENQQKYWVALLAEENSLKQLRSKEQRVTALITQIDVDLFDKRDSIELAHK